jgi:hypothetical protein
MMNLEMMNDVTRIKRGIINSNRSIIYCNSASKEANN